MHSLAGHTIWSCNQKQVLLNEPQTLPLKTTTQYFKPQPDRSLLLSVALFSSLP